ncbi:MAG: hypothetical protein HY769_02660 [Candidatus Stahlbacteria bacterium]|nr:hypothetical protein [Candidatus Stahlbacteria bacterium]
MKCIINSVVGLGVIFLGVYPQTTVYADSWAKAYGGTGDDQVYSIQQISDGGYIVAGSTTSFGAGKEDFLIIKLDNTGNIFWTKTFGTPYGD